MRIVAVGDCAIGNGPWNGAGTAGPGAGIELCADASIPKTARLLSTQGEIQEPVVVSHRARLFFVNTGARGEMFGVFTYKGADQLDDLANF